MQKDWGFCQIPFPLMKHIKLFSIKEIAVDTANFLIVKCSLVNEA